MKKFLSLTLAVILAFSCFTGCSAGEKSGLTKITLSEVAHSIFYAPMYVAMEEGYFADEGIDLTLVTGFGANYLVQNSLGPYSKKEVDLCPLPFFVKSKNRHK